jgi:SAM-dependent methyltransferase
MHETLPGDMGRDVMFLPTEESLVEKMVSLAKLRPQDRLIDLGSGDGRMVIAAAKRGARALGIEYNPRLVALAKRNAAKERVADRAEFIEADIFETDFSDSTVITMFLLPELNLRLRSQILDLKPGTRIVSNSYDMGDWKPDDSTRAEADCSIHCTAYLWIVPAKAGGIWKLPDGELTLIQTFQMLSGSVLSGGTTSLITAGRLKGEEIRFSAGETEYFGFVTGNTMEGTVNYRGTAAKWSATKTAPR